MNQSRNVFEEKLDRLSPRDPPTVGRQSDREARFHVAVRGHAHRRLRKDDLAGVLHADLPAPAAAAPSALRASGLGERACQESRRPQSALPSSVRRVREARRLPLQYRPDPRRASEWVPLDVIDVQNEAIQPPATLELLVCFVSATVDSAQSRRQLLCIAHAHTLASLS